MATATFCTSGMVLRKAGAGHSSALDPGGASAMISTEATVELWIEEAESTVNNICRFNFTDNFTSLNNDTKMILREVASAIAAIQAIQFDMSGYTSRTEAEDMINLQRDIALRGLGILRDKKVTDFINGS